MRQPCAGLLAGLASSGRTPVTMQAEGAGQSLFATARGITLIFAASASAQACAASTVLSRRREPITLLTTAVTCPPTAVDQSCTQSRADTTIRMLFCNARLQRRQSLALAGWRN